MQSSSHEPEMHEDRKRVIRDRARELGFVACGFAPASPLHRERALRQWLAEGRHGYMDYLARDARARTQPARYLAGARTAIVVASAYKLASAPSSDWRARLVGRIASYATAVDYHDEIGERLARLGDFVASLCGGSTRVHVDAGPLLEKELALRAGLGWFGRHSNILLPWQRSSVLLGCLLSDRELPPDRPFLSSHCGDCRDCMPACPTAAIEADAWLDARRCISYLTIEHRGPIPLVLRPQMGNWIFGCDVCLQVCPWTPPACEQTDPWLEPSLEELLLMTETGFRERYRHSPLWRTRRRGIARNAAVALGNSRNPGAAGALGKALRSDAEPLVRAHAAWGLGRIGDQSSLALLRAALERESVPPVRREIEAALSSFR